MTKSSSVKAVPLYVLEKSTVGVWLKQQSTAHQRWLKSQAFSADSGAYMVLADKDGKPALAIIGAGEAVTMWSLADLATQLPKGRYQLANESAVKDPTSLYLGYLLGRYQFDEYKTCEAPRAELIAPKKADVKLAERLRDSIFLARGLINRPPNDLNPTSLTQIITDIGKQYGAKVSVIKGEALQKEYPAVYAVGKASSTPPALVDLRWGSSKHPKVTLVGKGVSFDSGGLNIKTGSGMRLMKKDMGGAASALATAKAVMDAKLNVQLRLLIPTVENAISGNAMRPSDVIQTRKGLTVEVGNTDAEGRLILCDALAEADKEKPDLLVDFATLTGAARVALGTDLPAYFTDSEPLATKVEAAMKQTADLMWRMPLYNDYAKKLESSIADISNDASTGYGGAITAALFLKRFVEQTTNWMHIDMMGWNMDARPGRPVGGEAHAMRTIYSVIQEIAEGAK